MGRIRVYKHRQRVKDYIGEEAALKERIQNTIKKHLEQIAII